MRTARASILLFTTGVLAACGPSSPYPSTGSQASSSPGPTPVLSPGAECAPTACGPAPGMPAEQCADGSLGGNTGRCIMQPAGACGWEIRSCPSSPGPSSPPGSPPQAPPAAGDCARTGCSGTICAEPGRELATTCEFRPEYACYASARCERQPDGSCGWTRTAELESCLASPPTP